MSSVSPAPNPEVPASDQKHSAGWRTFLTLLTGLGFVALLALACPPIKHAVIEAAPPQVVAIRKNPDLWSDWMAFIELFAEVMLALLLGGAVLAEFAANRARLLLHDAGSAVQTAAGRKVDAAVRNVKTAVDELAQVAKDPSSLPVHKALRKTMLNLYLLYHEGRGAPRTFMWYVISSALRYFPQGMFGIATVGMFFILTASKVTKLYVEAVEQTAHQTQQGTSSGHVPAAS